MRPRNLALWARSTSIPVRDGLLQRPGRRRDVELGRAEKRRCGDVDGFSWHADVGVPARDRAKLERLCRYVARPAIASERLELLPDGRVRYRFKRAWQDGSVAVEFECVPFYERGQAPPGYENVGFCAAP